MNPSIKAVFAQGLLVAIAANLLADAMASHAREQGYTSQHVAMLGLIVFAIFLLVWSTEHRA